MVRISYDSICKYCGSEMQELRKESIADTTYHYLKCPRCKKEVARRED